MAGLARHGEVELECPFCGKAKIKTYHKEGYIQAKTSRISSGGKQTFHRVDDKYIVAADCPNCGKNAKEIESAFNRGVTREIPHEERVERMRKAGVPTAFEDKIIRNEDD